MAMDKEDQPYHVLRNMGVMTVDDVIEKLSALSPETRKIPLVVQRGDGSWWDYIGEVKSPDEHEDDGYSWPTLILHKRDFDTRDL